MTKKIIQESLKLGYLHFEKCELKEAFDLFLKAYEMAENERDLYSQMEAMAGILRYSAESQDSALIAEWQMKLRNAIDRATDQAAKKVQRSKSSERVNTKNIPSMAWYCLGVISNYEKNYLVSQKYFLRCLQAAENEEYLADEERLNKWARAWAAVANNFRQRSHFGRATFISETILNRLPEEACHGVRGVLFLNLGVILESKGDLEGARKYIQKADTFFLEEHHWYHHLYALYGYARLARKERKYSEANWYLELLEKATKAEHFKNFHSEISNERERLKDDTIDLWLDIKKGIVKTRENPEISLRKQYLLLEILKSLGTIHLKKENASIGLTKAEIVGQVWREKYRPETHDNKLYYNINRLRRLIEPDLKNPKYLLNWKQGYRLAPGLNVHIVNDSFQKNERN